MVVKYVILRQNTECEQYSGFISYTTKRYLSKYFKSKSLNTSFIKVVCKVDGKTILPTWPRDHYWPIVTQNGV